MVEQERLVAQDLQPIEILGPLVVLDRRHRGLQSRDVRLDRDGGALAEQEVHPVARDAQQPGRGARARQPGGRPRHAPAVSGDGAIG